MALPKPNRPARGVYPVEPCDAPPPPPNARGREIRDSSGQVIAYAWVIPQHDTKLLDTFAKTWLELHDPPEITPTISFLRRGVELLK